MTKTLLPSRLRLALSCSALLWMAGCTSVPPAPTGELALPAAVGAGVEQLLAKAQPGPGWMTRFQRRTLNLESVLDRPSGQQTRGTLEVESQFARKLAADYPQVTIAAPGDAARADWALSSALVWRQDNGQPRRPTLEMTLSDPRTGKVLAETSMRVRTDSVDSTPTLFFQDSPVLIPAPGAAPNAAQRATAASLAAPIRDAMATYDAGRSDEALTLFETAGKTGGADDMRVQIGLYLANRKLGRNDDAAKAFAQIVTIGIAKRSLAVKFLFEPAKTEFWSDPAVSGQYGVWIDEIAKHAAQSAVCIAVIGHSSHTGTPEYNDQLALQRANRIGEMLTQAAPALGTRLQESGRGFRENLIGTGTDDVRDALDRRVEFKFDAC